MTSPRSAGPPLDGRINEELGNHQKAIDIYDEVTANEPEEGREISPYMMQFFAENFLYRTRLQAKLGKFDDLILEAEDWLDRNSARKCDAYYGVMLEVAQVHVANAEKLADEAEKKKLLSKVMRTLRDVKNANSSYQSDILLLLRKYSSAAGEESMEAGTFDEAVALADVAIENQEYAEAAKLFGRALELKDQEKNQDRLQQVEYFWLRPSCRREMLQLRSPWRISLLGRRRKPSWLPRRPCWRLTRR